MLKENCFLLGTIFKLHGYKGDVTIFNEEHVMLSNFYLLKKIIH